MLRSLLSRLNPFSKAPHLAVVYVEYDRKKGEASDRIFATLQRYLSALTGCRVTYVRVDNRHEGMPITKDGSNVFTVGGDNSFREFSGWQRGISALAALPCPYDLLLLTNEMFLKPGPSFLQDYATPELLKRSLSAKKIIGRIDTAFQEYTLFGYDVSTWVCTNCLFVPKQAVDALGSIVLLHDNRHEIFRRDYDPRHLLQREKLSLSSDMVDFVVHCDLPAGHGNEIRCRFEAAMAEHESPRSHDDRPLLAMIRDLTLNQQPIPEDRWIRGLRHEQGALWAEATFLLDLPRDEAKPAHLVIKGCLPPETRQKIINNAAEMVVYNDAMLYQDKPPINKTYQRWIVEWLTERWHSRFEINQQTWELFKLKAAAIFNESLLTAKFRELGYPPETYGNKKYY